MLRGWEGDRVRLVPLEKARHLENALTWMNDPEVTLWTLMGDLPLTRLAEERYFEETSRQEDKVSFAVETLEGEHIGFAGIHDLDWRHGVAKTGTIIGRRDLWGKGYGSDAARARTRYAFEVLGLRLLMSEVMADNVGSLRMLARAGYREAGRIPGRYWKRGSYRDAVLMIAERSSSPTPP